MVVFKRQGEKPVEELAPPAKGHNSGFAADTLLSFVERVERLTEEKDALAADIREVFSEAKGTGYDTKIMRQVIRLRKMDKADFQEQAALLDLYWSALETAMKQQTRSSEDDGE